jgi:hypothetical protein
MRIDLPDASIEALRELADRERRDLRDQAEHLIIRALSRRGLVSRDGLERKGAEAERQGTATAAAAVRSRSSSWN